MKCREKHSMPDWTDVSIWIKTIEAEREANVSVVLGVLGVHAPFVYTISIVAVRTTLPTTDETSQIGVCGHWPNRENRTMEGAFLRLLMDLDKQADEAWWRMPPGLGEA